MDTPANPPLPTRSLLPRWLRVGVFLALIMLVQGTLAYLLTWIDPPREPDVVSIRVHSYLHWSSPKSRHSVDDGTKNAEKLAEIRQSLDGLASRSEQEPVIVHLSAIAVQAEAGRVYVIPGDARPDDPAGWLPLREVLEKLKACPSKHKLLVFEWTAPAALDRLGFIYHDVAAALPGELDAVPDADRLVLSACSPGQQTHFSDELGQSVFAHYFEQGLLGHADGYGAARDTRVSVREMAAFLQARISRWTLHNRGEHQTPTLLGTGSDFTLVNVDPNAPGDKTPALAEIKEGLDADQGRQRWLPAFSNESFPEAATKKTLDEQRRILEQQLAGAKPADAERLKNRFVEDLRAKLPAAELDAAVFAHVLADPRLEPGMLRLFDQLLHPAPAIAPRSARGLYVRQLADLAMRVEAQAWPRDLIATFLHAADAGERALQMEPRLPGYVALLEEPALTRHAGAMRLWTHGYANPDDAKRLLNAAHDQVDMVMKLNNRWRSCEIAFEQTMAELPWYLEALESMPELRKPWREAAISARALADTLKQTQDEKLPWQHRVENLTAKVLAAEKHLHALQKHRQALHAPFDRDAVARLERQCRTPNADAPVRQTAAALLSVSTPMLHTEDCALLAKALRVVSRRLNEEILALDRQDDEAQRQTPAAEVKMPPEPESRRAARRAAWRLALLESTGVSEERLRRLRGEVDACARNANNPIAWCDLGVTLRQLSQTRQPQPQLEKAPPDRWLLEHQRFLARDYLELNLDTPGIVAARAFYAPPDETKLEARVRLSATPVEPLTEKYPYADLWLEVTRSVPPGAFGPVELRFHCADDVWLDIAPDSASLPGLIHSREPRTLTHKVPVRAMRKPKAERTGLKPPLGFMVEARFEGRSYLHAVTVPILSNSQDLQILVSADPDEPVHTLNEIRVRPGKVKQPHYVYVRNLTNRTHKVHVEVNAGETLLHKSQKLLTLEPDGMHKVRFDDGIRASVLSGPLAIRVFDAERQKVLAERAVRVEILAPQEYVKVAEASFEPGREGNNKWAVHVSASRTVAGPAIAAQLVLPVQRIPGLLSIGGGTLQVELPIRSESPRILFAERLNLIHAIEEEGPVYLHIDGVPRAFVYRTTFARAGAPTLPTPDDRPAVRLIAPLCVRAGVNCLIDVEVDNAPRGAWLEVALGRTLDDNSFKAEIVREFTDAKKHRIDLEASKDALVFDAAIGDWTAMFDTRAIVGPRAVRARLVDAAGRVIAQSRQSLVIDDSPPVARIAPLPAQVKKGSVLQVQGQGVDPESGVAQVVFFFGKPDKGEIPPGARRFKPVPANRELTQWSAALKVPADHTGAFFVSMQVVNHAGMASIDTVTLEVTDHDPGKTGFGEIRGNVTEGPRLQPNLLVTLLDEHGKEIARTKTQADGAYVFGQLAPGRYRVVCVKPESQRRAVLDVAVEPDRLARVDLALKL